MTDAPNNGVPTPPESAAPQYQAPGVGAPVPPAYASAPAPAENPGKLMGILALVGAFVVAPLGIVFGFIGLNQSKKAGFKNPLALAGIIIGAIAVIFGIIGTIIFFTTLGAVANDPSLLYCPSLESGQTYTMDGKTFTCP